MKPPPKPPSPSKSPPGATVKQAAAAPTGMQWPDDDKPETCRYCDITDVIEVLTPELKHYAKSMCRGCGSFINWVSKPDSDKTKRPAKHLRLVEKHGDGWCEMCLISVEDLPDGETLEAHHITPYQKGGHSEGHERENIWIVCTRCHRIIEHERTYTGHWIKFIKKLKGKTK